MSKVINLPERQDAEGTWHMVLKDKCGWCGCAFLVAEDDHDPLASRGLQPADGAEQERHAGDRRERLEASREARPETRREDDAVTPTHRPRARRGG